jgi:hypothetical protein
MCMCMCMCMHMCMLHVHVACACCPGWPAIPRPYRAWFPQRCCSRAPGSMTKPTACNPLGASSAPRLLAYSPRTCCALPARGPSDVFRLWYLGRACGTFATGIPQWRARLAPAAACRVLSCSEFTPNSHQVSGNISNSRPPGIHYPCSMQSINIECRNTGGGGPIDRHEIALHSIHHLALEIERNRN